MNRILLSLIAITGAAAALAWAILASRALDTFEEIVTQNEQLQEAIQQLTREEQIGYAKVISQQAVDGELVTRVRFVETARGDPETVVLEREYSLPGETIFFDALVVKFGDQLVLDGKERALYLWRRVYSDAMAPSSGLPLEIEGREPERYREWLARLPVGQRELFWSEIWDLANDPKRLAHLGIEAIYGNALYFRMKPGNVYFFKIGATGQIVPEVAVDL